MAIFEEKAYGVQCDRCREIFENPISGFTLWCDTSQPMDEAQNYSWIEHEGKHYCPDCYEYDMNENVIIKPLRTAPYQKNDYSKGLITWDAHLKAYEGYAAKYGRSQSAERIAERGGFGEGELDKFLPNWRVYIVNE